MQFEWDPDKARSNILKHGVSFDEASTVFEDALSLTVPDPMHSKDEDRFVLTGISHRNRLLIVIHTDRDNRVRIVMARRAARKERIQYETNG